MSLFLPLCCATLCLLYRAAQLLLPLFACLSVCSDIFHPSLPSNVTCRLPPPACHRLAQHHSEGGRDQYPSEGEETGVGFAGGGAHSHSHAHGNERERVKQT